MTLDLQNSLVFSHFQGNHVGSQDSATPPNHMIPPMTTPATSTPKPHPLMAHGSSSSGGRRLPLEFISGGGGAVSRPKASLSMSGIVLGKNSRVVQMKTPVKSLSADGSPKLRQPMASPMGSLHPGKNTGESSLTPAKAESAAKQASVPLSEDKLAATTNQDSVSKVKPAVKQLSRSVQAPKETVKQLSRSVQAPKEKPAAKQLSRSVQAPKEKPAAKQLSRSVQAPKEKPAAKQLSRSVQAPKEKPAAKQLSRSVQGPKEKPAAKPKGSEGVPALEIIQDSLPASTDDLYADEEIQAPAKAREVSAQEPARVKPKAKQGSVSTPKLSKTPAKSKVKLSSVPAPPDKKSGGPATTKPATKQVSATGKNSGAAQPADSAKKSANSAPGKKTGGTKLATKQDSAPSTGKKSGAAQPADSVLTGKGGTSATQPAAQQDSRAPTGKKSAAKPAKPAPAGKKSGAAKPANAKQDSAPALTTRSKGQSAKAAEKSAPAATRSNGGKAIVTKQKSLSSKTVENTSRKKTAISDNTGTQKINQRLAIVDTSHQGKERSLSRLKKPQSPLDVYDDFMEMDGPSRESADRPETYIVPLKSSPSEPYKRKHNSSLCSSSSAASTKSRTALGDISQAYLNRGGQKRMFNLSAVPKKKVKKNKNQKVNHSNCSSLNSSMVNFEAGVKAIPDSLPLNATQQGHKSSKAGEKRQYKRVCMVLKDSFHEDENSEEDNMDSSWELSPPSRKKAKGVPPSTKQKDRVYKSKPDVPKKAVSKATLTSARTKSKPYTKASIYMPSFELTGSDLDEYGEEQGQKQWERVDWNRRRPRNETRSPGSTAFSELRKKASIKGKASTAGGQKMNPPVSPILPGRGRNSHRVTNLQARDDIYEPQLSPVVPHYSPLTEHPPLVTQTQNSKRLKTSTETSQNLARHKQGEASGRKEQPWNDTVTPHRASSSGKSGGKLDKRYSEPAAPRALLRDFEEEEEEEEEEEHLSGEEPRVGAVPRDIAGEESANRSRKRIIIEKAPAAPKKQPRRSSGYHSSYHTSYHSNIEADDSTTGSFCEVQGHQVSRKSPHLPHPLQVGADALSPQHLPRPSQVGADEGITKSFAEICHNLVAQSGKKGSSVAAKKNPATKSERKLTAPPMKGKSKSRKRPRNEEMEDEEEEGHEVTNSQISKVSYQGELSKSCDDACVCVLTGNREQTLPEEL